MPVLAGERLVALDVETTGWDPRSDSIVELARVALDDDRCAEPWESLVRSPVPMPADVVRVHGITDAMLADAPAAEEVAGRFRDGCADATLVVHNARFDLAFLNRLLRGAGIRPLHNAVVDTLGLARGLFGPGGNTLGELALRLGIPHDRLHRALPDARVTAGLLVALAPRWEAERGVRSLAELAAMSQDAIRLTRRRPSRPAPSFEGLNASSAAQAPDP